jgi:hypothetical protein
LGQGATASKRICNDLDALLHAVGLMTRSITAASENKTLVALRTMAKKLPKSKYTPDEIILGNAPRPGPASRKAVERTTRESRRSAGLFVYISSFSLHSLSSSIITLLRPSA